MAPEIKVLFSVSAKDPNSDIQSETLRLRVNAGLPVNFVSIGRVDETSMLLMTSSEEDAGALYHWPCVDDGFRLRDPDFDTVFRLYFRIDELLSKLGPRKNREDLDAHFLRLYWSASNAQNGPKVADQLIVAGYDINFVLPSFVHPIFASMKGDAFNVAERLIVLGTRGNHLDNEGKSVLVWLEEHLKWWRNRLEDHPNRDTIHDMAKRRIQSIEAALSHLES